MSGTDSCGCAAALPLGSGVGTLSGPPEQPRAVVIATRSKERGRIIMKATSKRPYRGRPPGLAVMLRVGRSGSPFRRRVAIPLMLPSNFDSLPDGARFPPTRRSAVAQLGSIDAAEAARAFEILVRA